MDKWKNIALIVMGGIILLGGGIWVGGSIHKGSTATIANTAVTSPLAAQAKANTSPTTQTDTAQKTSTAGSDKQTSTTDQPAQTTAPKTSADQGSNTTDSAPISQPSPPPQAPIATDENVFAQDVAFMKSKNVAPGGIFDTPPVNDPNVIVSDGFGNYLYAWDVQPTPIGDGSLHQVYFFIGTRFLGTDTAEIHGRILNMRSAGVGSISVTYAKWNSGDPECCPTGIPFKITYHWDGKKLTPDAPFQNQGN